MIQIAEKYSGKIPEEQEHKTVIFERKYGVDIRDYSTTTEVDKFIESQIERKLRLVEPRGYGLVPEGESLEDYTLNDLVDKTIENIDN
ncbi:MAG: hypothetical protein KAT28_05385 [Candidatus Aenigmarchaeota archaeon]|nr:hypothetical protein [Candidatus Aenigmarchaeota archaeon]